MIKLETIISNKNIVVELENWYSLWAGFIESIESGLSIWYSYGVLKSTHLFDNEWKRKKAGFRMKKGKEKREIKVVKNKPLWDKKGIWEKLYNLI